MLLENINNLIEEANKPRPGLLTRIGNKIKNITGITDLSRAERNLARRHNVRNTVYSSDSPEELGKIANKQDKVALKAANEYMRLRNRGAIKATATLGALGAGAYGIYKLNNKDDKGK